MEASPLCLRLLSLTAKNRSHDEKNDVPYLNQTQQNRIRFQIIDGRLVNSTGKPLSYQGMRLMVVEPDGALLADAANGRFPFHHSSLAAGEPVAMAGWISVVDGVPKVVTNTSGHYKPSLKHLLALVEYWRELNVPLDDLQVGFRVAITSSLANTFYYTMPVQDFVEQMKSNPKTPERLLNQIIHSNLPYELRAKAVAHLYMTDGIVGESEAVLLRKAVEGGNKTVIDELFDLLPSDHFSKIIQLIEGLDSPRLHMLREQYEELELERRYR